MTSDETLEQRLDQLESRADVSDLVAGFCEGIDRRDPDRFMSLWHEDAEYLISGRGDFVGLEQITHSQQMIQEIWRETHHWTCNHTLYFTDSDRATGRSDAFAICADHDGKVVLVSCTYHDSFERRSGVWKISRRLVERYFVSTPIDIELRAP